MTALNLADYAASPKLLVAGVAKILQAESQFMNLVSFPTKASLSVKVIREGGLPTISWRKLGAAHASNRASNPDEVQEAAFSFGNYIDVDKVYLKDQSERFYDPQAYQIAQGSKAMAREFNDATINGSPAVNADRPTGLAYRILNDITGQDIDAGSTTGLDISPDATSLSTNIQTYFDKLDKLIYACADHKADIILCNDTAMMRHWSLARQSGLLSTTTDNLGREFPTYKGAKFCDMGFKIDDTTKILPDTELATGAAQTGGASTSLYAVHLGAEFFTPWQMYEMEVGDPKLTDDQVTYRTVIDWVVGLALSNPRSVARLHGLIAA
jgi:hypothetical protein